MCESAHESELVFLSVKPGDAGHQRNLMIKAQSLAPLRSVAVSEGFQVDPSWQKLHSLIGQSPFGFLKFIDADTNQGVDIVQKPAGVPERGKYLA